MKTSCVVLLSYCRQSSWLYKKENEIFEKFKRRNLERRNLERRNLEEEELGSATQGLREFYLLD